MKRDFFRIFSAKDRNEQGRANPLFPAAKIPRWKKYLAVTAGTVILFGGGYLSYRYATSPALELSVVELTGVYSLNYQDIMALINQTLDTKKLLILSDRQKFIFDKTELASKLEKNFTLKVTDVSVDEQTVKIAVSEDIVMVALQAGDDWLLVSLDGNIVRHLIDVEITFLTKTNLTPDISPIPFNKLPKLRINSPLVSSDPGTNLFTPQLLPALIELDDGLKTASLTAKEYKMETIGDPWLTVAINEKPYSILVDLKKPIAEQLSMLKTVMSDYSGKDSTLSYIDVRFGNHVYVK